MSEQLEIGQVVDSLYQKSKNLGYDYLKDRIEKFHEHHIQTSDLNLDCNSLDGLKENLEELYEYIKKIIEQKTSDGIFNFHSISLSNTFEYCGSCENDIEIDEYVINFNRFETEDEFIDRMNKIKETETRKFEKLMDDVKTSAKKLDIDLKDFL